MKQTKKEESVLKNPKGAWRMLIGAVLLQFSVVGLTINAFSVYLPYLLALCGMTNTGNASVVMVRSGAALLALLLVGKIYDKLELRCGITVSVCLAAGSLWLYSVAGSYWHLALAAVAGGLAYGLGGMYAVSLLIHRWFRVHEPLALGICSATTGLATVIGAPAATAMIEYGSVQHALRMEAAFLLLCGLGCWLLIRNRPVGLEVSAAPQKKKKKSIRISSMHLAALFIGVLGNTAFQFLAMHFSVNGFSAFQISALVSAAGISLMASKFFFGMAVDHWGAYRSNWLFFGLSAVGAVMCCMVHELGGALTAVILFCIGLAFATVGLTVYAEDLAKPEAFSGTLRQFQICYLLGGMLFSPIPGLLADWTGSYVSFYLLAAVVCLAALGIIQWNYRVRRKKTALSS